MTTLDVIKDTFAFLDDWEDRYRYIIELGNAAAALPDSQKTEQNKVRGCMSQVWIVHEVKDDSPQSIYFRADSDAHIVRGLIAVLMAAYSGKTAAEILSLDIYSLFQDLGLSTHLSPNRSNGFFSMVKRIRAIATTNQ